MHDGEQFAHEFGTLGYKEAFGYAVLLPFQSANLLNSGFANHNHHKIKK